MNFSGLWKDEEKENLFFKTEQNYCQTSNTKTTKHSKIMISGVTLCAISSVVNFSSELCISVIFNSHLFITFTHFQAPDCQHSEQRITNSFFHDIPHPIHPQKDKFFPNLQSKPTLCQFGGTCRCAEGQYPLIFLKVMLVPRKKNSNSLSRPIKGCYFCALQSLTGRQLVQRMICSSSVSPCHIITLKRNNYKHLEVFLLLQTGR